MIVAKKDFAAVDFSFFNGGLNSNDPHCAIRENQAYSGSINARFMKKGFMRAPGFHGLSDTPTFAAICKGLDIYSLLDGTDILIGYSGGKIYSINKTTNEVTEIYDLTGNGECYGVSFYGKLFVTNGSKSCVIETDVGYPIGIAPPSGVTAAAAAGGSLPEGVYKIFVGYARKVAGLNVQYSVGQAIADVTLTAGNKTISISNFANSSDGRVNNKVVWLTDAGGGVYYLYHQTNNNTTTSFSVSSDSGKNASILYRVWGEPSKQPPTMTGLYAHDDRLFGWYGNTLYASMKATTAYDLERWPEIQYEFPFKIISLFSIGADLFINSARGIFKLPDADMAASYKQVTKRLYFMFDRTVSYIDENSKENPSPVIGVTNDGVRIFDGNSFSIDLSKDIKSDIKKLIDGSSSTFKPNGFVYRSEGRTEYRIGYRDTTINALCNNRQLVLNLDSVVINSNTDYTAPWELWQTGFQYSAIDSSGTLFMLQNLAESSQVFKESYNDVCDVSIYDDDGSFLATKTCKECKVKSRLEIVDISSRIIWETMRTLAQLNSDATIRIEIGEEFDISKIHTIQKSGSGIVPVFDEVLFDEVTFVSEQPIIGKNKLQQNLKGASVFVEFTQTANDPTMQVLEIKLYGIYETGRYV